MFDKFRDECGVFGIFGHAEASNLTYLGLYALQHRGQESAGIATTNGERVQVIRQMGYVADIFDETKLAELAGHAAIGHVRYSTAGESRAQNAQPLLIECAHGQIGVCHNGNLVNANELREQLVRDGSIFQTTSDTEVALHLYARSRASSVEDAIVESLAQVTGAYSMLFITKDRVIAARDPHGFRPLALGRLGSAYIVCSETCALDLIGATYVRDVEPGEVLVISSDGVRSLKPFPPARLTHCVFEHVYFARPDSDVFGQSVNASRTEMGRQLAREAPADADVVVPVPDSGVCAATGYAEEAGLPMRMGLIRNHYVGRTFIEPQQSIRHFGVRVKLNPVRSILEGKRVILLDDSIVRGTTSRKIVKMVKAAGATEVHVRISCPPTISPCFYGVDTPRRSELIAATHTIEEIRRYLNADSLAYLSLPGLLSCMGPKGPSCCTSCYTGHYPVEFPRDADKYLQLALKLETVPMTRVAIVALGSVLAIAAPARSDARAQTARPTTTTSAQPATGRQPAQQQGEPVSAEALAEAIDNLGRIDYAVRSRAAQVVRRASGAQAVPALVRAVDEHADGYVRFRALVLLSGFNDPRAVDVMRRAIDDPNDRLREVAYAYYAAHPDRKLLPVLLKKLEAEVAEFVRPVLVRALAALDEDPGVQKTLVAEANRGQDLFRSAVIEALGQRKAVYAVPTLIGIAKLDGPLRDDAVIALGRIGDKRALETFATLQQEAGREAQPTIATAICLLGVNCASHRGFLQQTVTFAAKNQIGFQPLLRSAARGLGVLAERGDAEAFATIVDVGVPSQDPVRAPLVLALGSAAIGNPTFLLDALARVADLGGVTDMLVEAFDLLEEDFLEERFFVTVRRAYWQAPEGSETRRVGEALIRKLDF